MKKIKHLYSTILIITVPILIVLLAFNITLRNSEVYSYYFNESQSIDYTTLDVTTNELASEFSSFVNDLFSNEVDITENAGYERDPIFNDTEAEVLYELKTNLSFTLYIALALLVLDIALFVILHKRREDELLFKSIEIDAIITVVMIIVTGILIGSSSFRKMLYASLINIPLPKDSVLMILFSKGSFVGVINTSYIALAIILLILILYIIWYITKPERLFNNRR